MSDLPPGWEEVRIGDLGEDVRVSVKPDPEATYELYSVPTYPSGKPELLRGSEIGSSKRAVQPGDVLLCKINPRINRVWIVAEPAGVGPQIASPEYLILRTTDLRLARYLRWYFQSPGFRRWIELSVEGATGSHTRAKSGPILEQLVPVPPVEEQERIVTAVEEDLSRLDAAEAALDSASGKAAVLRRAALLNGFQLDAPVAALADVAQVVSGQTPKGLGTAEKGSVPFFKVGDMNTADAGVLRRSRTMLSEESIVLLGLHLRPPGTVVFPKRGGAIATNKKRVLGCRAAFDLNTMGVIAGEDLDGRYLRWWFETLDLSSLSDGSNVPQINHGDIAPLGIPVPPLDGQQRVVAALDAVETHLVHLIRQIELARSRAGVLRRTVLAAAFTGQLIPQHLDDEPASLLLERIWAERKAATRTKRTRKAKAS